MSRAYSPGLRPPAGKSGLTAGMVMTEKQGGSDVRATTTRAVALEGGGPETPTRSPDTSGSAPRR